MKLSIAAFHSGYVLLQKLLKCPAFQKHQALSTHRCLKVNAFLGGVGFEKALEKGSTWSFGAALSPPP